MQSISDILKAKGVIADYHNKHEFQAYGNMLAEKLGDLAHRTLYIKLAKEEDRRLLDGALAFALDTEKRAGLGKLFMWRLKELRKERDLNFQIRK
ncbi:hypothetical protein COT50_00955 [candidate division WWE3 bacterium CG08_land_8_20_14_0_20_41_10]|uniref:Uncharacterized protein n=1 Tax=candidate division WWE3 bacterium CG08_land_8_20_14_0_20_41_10 TaxID=1975085 RepID=A0A2H0XCI3_UNCKA|nr:MAG: hypothetical protein COT50_00955 [candidate division WWE3 bacterium CG08_land_8_20_14_0_20_41_10]